MALRCAFLPWLLLLAGACTRAPAGATRADPAPADPLAAAQAFSRGRPAWASAIDPGDAPRDRSGAVMGLSAEACGSCHAEALASWKGSTHAKAWVDPQLQAEMRKSDNRWLCANCHTPLARQQPTWTVAMVEEDVERPVYVDNPAHDAALQQEGVTCAACHLRGGEILGTKDSPGAPHAVRGTPELREAAFCGRCHQAEATWPDKSFACAFTTVEEWSRSPAAAAGVPCQGCHMRAGADGHASHAFAGSGLAKVPGQNPEAQPAPTLEAVPANCEGSPGVEVALTNAWAGHPVPAGDPERFLSVEVSWRDASDAAVGEPARAELGQVWRWSTPPVKLSDNRLAPGERRAWCFASPAGASRAQVRAKRHRMREEAARYHALTGYPTEMTFEEREVEILNREAPAVERDSRDRPNLCRLSDSIVLATVTARESRRAEARYGPTVRTRTTLSIQQGLRGERKTGETLSLELAGGEADGLGMGVPGAPSLEEGASYLLFLREAAALPEPVLQGHFRVPAGALLPSEGTLREIWAATCAAHPEGIYFRGPAVRLVIPTALEAGELRDSTLRGDRLDLPEEAR